MKRKEWKRDRDLFFSRLLEKPHRKIFVIPAPIFIGINSSRNPVFSRRFWTPAFAGVTETGFFSTLLKC
jgi:hypothetical protein